MNDFLERLVTVDLDGAARNTLGFLENVDPCFFGLVVGVLVFLGSRVVSGHSRIQSWGLRLAVSAFLLYGGYLWLAGTLDNGEAWWRHALRCGGVAGIVLAVSWIVLPILCFVHRRLRLGLAAFLGYGGYVALSAEEFSLDHAQVAALHGLAAAGLALVVAWIVDPFWVAVTGNLFAKSTDAKTPATTPVAEPATPARPALVSPALIGNLDLDPEAQRRRDRARMQLELAYLEAMPGIASWMPRPLFDDFLRRHLADQLPPGDVEENARQLLLVLQRHQEHVHERSEFGSLEELWGWLLAEQQRIAALALDPPLKQSQLLDLHQRYLLLASRMMQRQTLPC